MHAQNKVRGLLYTTGVGVVFVWKCYTGHQMQILVTGNSNVTSQMTGKRNILQVFGFVLKMECFY